MSALGEFVEVHAAKWPERGTSHHKTLCGRAVTGGLRWVRVDGLRLHTVTCQGCKAALVRAALEVSG